MDPDEVDRIMNGEGVEQLGEEADLDDVIDLVNYHGKQIEMIANLAVSAEGFQRGGEALLGAMRGLEARIEALERTQTAVLGAMRGLEARIEALEYNQGEFSRLLKVALDATTAGFRRLDGRIDSHMDARVAGLKK